MLSLSASAASRTWKVLERTSAWLLLGRSLCAHTSSCGIQENPRLFLGLLSTGECEEQFMCRNTHGVEKGSAVCNDFRGSHWKVAFGKLRHKRAWFPITNMLNRAVIISSVLGKECGLKYWASKCRNIFPHYLCPERGTVQITRVSSRVC